MSSAPTPPGRAKKKKGESEPFIDVRSLVPEGAPRTAYGLIAKPFETFMGITRFNALFDELKSRNDKYRFFAEWLEAVGAKYSVPPEDLKKIPSEGPLFVIANHPFGGVDGMIIGELLTARRADYLLLGNSLLGRVPGIRCWLLPVNPFGGAAASRENVRVMKEARRHLEAGGCLATFPAGEVSSLDPRTRTVTDPEWSPHIARLVRQSKATVLPMWFEGRNSMLFQTAGLVNARARTALLVRELVNKRGRTIRLRIGDPIPASEMTGFADDEALTVFLRARVESLARRKKTA